MEYLSPENPIESNPLRVFHAASEGLISIKREFTFSSVSLNVAVPSAEVLTDLALIGC